MRSIRAARTPSPPAPRSSLNSAAAYEIHDERVFVVTDSFDDGRQCLTTIATWCDTRVPPPLARRLDAAHGVVTVEQDVRLRLFTSTSPAQ